MAIFKGKWLGIPVPWIRHGNWTSLIPDIFFRRKPNTPQVSHKKPCGLSWCYIHLQGTYQNDFEDANFNGEQVGKSYARR